MDPSPAPLTSDVNAMLWGQFHLRGGWSRILTFVGVYTAAVGGLVAVSVLAGDALPAAVKVGLVTAQGSILVLFAGGRVAGAIRQDVTSRMIDSHRLMPLSPAQAVAGYLVGGAAQPLALAAANLVLGVVVSAAVGTPTALWLTANAVLLSFAAFAVVAMAFGAFAGRGAPVVWLALLFTVMSSGGIGAVLPGLILLVTPMIGPSVMNLGVTGADAAVLYAPPALFQLWVGAVCFAAACRRYRSDDRPALGVDLGLALLAGWAAVSLFAMFKWSDYRPVVLGRTALYHPAQFIGSTVMAMVVGLIPLTGAALAAADWAGRRSLGDPSLGRRPAPPVLVALAATLLTLTLVTVPLAAGNGWPVGPHAAAVVRTAILLGAFNVGTLYAVRLLHRRPVLGKVSTLGPWLAVTWVLPLAVDCVRWYMQPARARRDDSFLQTASSFSPPGALIQIWTGQASETTWGLVFQAVTAAAVVAAFYLARPAGVTGAARQDVDVSMH